MNGLRSLLLCVLALAGLPGLALANSRSGVRDAAGLFHADTIARANKIIRSLEQKYHREVMIETIKTLPDEDRRALEGASWHKQLGQIFAKIGEREAQEQSLDGVLVLIFDDPSYKHWVQVTPWPRSRCATAGCPAARVSLAPSACNWDRQR